MTTNANVATRPDIPIHHGERRRRKVASLYGRRLTCTDRPHNASTVVREFCVCAPPGGNGSDGCDDDDLFDDDDQ